MIYSRLLPLKRASGTLVTALLMAGLLAGCAAPGPKIHSDYDHSVNFSAYKTFGFVDSLGTDKSNYSSLISAHFKAATREQMQALGYTYQKKSPDLLVNFFSNTENRTDVRTTPSVTASYGYFGYHTGLFFGIPVYGTDTKTQHYKVGTLNIDVIDAKQKKVIWEGTSEDKLDTKELDNPRGVIRRTVKQLFQHFPLNRPAATNTP